MTTRAEQRVAGIEADATFRLDRGQFTEIGLPARILDYQRRLSDVHLGTRDGRPTDGLLARHCAGQVKTVILFEPLAIPIE